MNYFIDNERQLIVLEDKTEVPLYSPEGFAIISDLWLKVGWDQKHLYSFAWMGRPVIQLPDDMLRIQEVIYTLKPDVIVETGIAHGGSLIFYASLCKAMELGRVIGIDIDIRSHNRTAIEAHELYPYIEMFEGSSIDPDIFGQVRDNVGDAETVLVLLDSCHDYEHVLEELKIYGQLVSPGSYIVCTDGSQEYMNVTPRAQKEYPHCDTWPTNNPKRAAVEFVAAHSDFEFKEPDFPFNEGPIDYRITHWPSAFIRRRA